MLDAHLVHLPLLAAQASHELDGSSRTCTLLHKYSRRVAFQVWDKGICSTIHNARKTFEQRTRL